MAKIRLKLKDGQELGYIRIRDGQPYYSYSEFMASEITLTEAQKLCKRFSKSYICIIEEPKKNKPKEDKHIKIKYV